MVERETMEFDVVVVGAGPAGLSCAIRLAQQAQEKEQELMICVVEKGSEVGAHILSGAVFETKALDELLPDWEKMGAPITTKVTQDDIYLFKDEQKALSIPHIAVPKTFKNHGNYIVSMGNVCRWLAEQAENLGVEVFPGFSAHSIICEDNQIKGIITGDMGVDNNGQPKDSYMPGMELRAKYTVFAEGCRGHLGKQLIKQFKLDENTSPQHYGLGFKEIWQVPPEQHKEGTVVHGTGWPLTSDTHGGSFMYHAENNQVVVGLIVDLNYSNPYLSPFDEFQRMKHHPVFKSTLQGAERVSYGARAIAKGGFHSLPKMHFPGGLLVGCDAGTLNFAKIKGNHTAMKSGMIAADSIIEALASESPASDLSTFTEKFKSSWLYDELYQSRNFGPVMHKFGKIIGGAYNTLDQNLFSGALPFTFKDNLADHDTLESARDSIKIDYPKPDGTLSFDKLSSVFLSNTNHEESQPCHLQLHDPVIPIKVNLAQFDEPAQRYCPAGVYEITENDSNEPQFVINAQNCVHCKTCDIKDPSQNITWVTPEGAGGPNYPNM
ncbi:electron transfer flavoprotein-ubiquinone oxidoreductase [Pseudoalteromonas sp. MMG012]|uniref:electron transfer flavoprotein-ubiquinone oxidoreductase n=1 Tax=Pseudoalteromonas sp. MMG012 TaxID=2822686 RepID=UPI001B3A2F36|nr:electron transfer flavoprotein-ubiquinone oxidoreductase [Pseudoalteromonas sp. MMG012]MBQ4851556.1 electron transfer flavoprotein-ubiquinone oxidoreductase [Pseudoalteromonas sp. MMG012]